MLIERLITIKETPDADQQHMSLTALSYGARARVAGIRGSGTGAQRLMEMGMVPGAAISVVRTAPLGDPLQICLRNYHLALRRVDADKITVFIVG